MRDFRLMVLWLATVPLFWLPEYQGNLYQSILLALCYSLAVHHAYRKDDHGEGKDKG